MENYHVIKVHIPDTQRRSFDCGYIADQIMEDGSLVVSIPLDDKQETIDIIRKFPDYVSAQQFLFPHLDFFESEGCRTYIIDEKELLEGLKKPTTVIYYIESSDGKLLCYEKKKGFYFKIKKDVQYLLHPDNLDMVRQINGRDQLDQMMQKLKSRYAIPTENLLIKNTADK